MSNKESVLERILSGKVSLSGVLAAIARELNGQTIPTAPPRNIEYPKPPEASGVRYGELDPAWDYAVILNDTQRVELYDPKENMRFPNHCAVCSAEFAGPVGEKCGYCGSIGRKSFLRPMRLRTLTEPPVLTPVEKKKRTRKGEGRSGLIKIDTTGNNNSAEFGDDVTTGIVDYMIVRAGDNFVAPTVRGKDINIGNDARITWLVLKPFATATIEDGAIIDQIIVMGDETKLVLGDDCVVGEILQFTHSFELIAGQGTKIKGNKKQGRNLQSSDMWDYLEKAGF